MSNKVVQRIATYIHALVNGQWLFDVLLTDVSESKMQELMGIAVKVVTESPHAPEGEEARSEMISAAYLQLLAENVRIEYIKGAEGGQAYPIVRVAVIEGEMAGFARQSVEVGVPSEITARYEGHLSSTSEDATTVH